MTAVPTPTKMYRETSYKQPKDHVPYQEIKFEKSLLDSMGYTDLANQTRFLDPSTGNRLTAETFDSLQVEVRKPLFDELSKTEQLNHEMNKCIQIWLKWRAAKEEVASKVANGGSAIFASPEMTETMQKVQTAAKAYQEAVVERNIEIYSHWEEVFIPYLS